MKVSEWEETQHWLTFSSTDGELSVPVENVDYILWEPGQETSMVCLKTGRRFEVSGTRRDLIEKMKNGV